VTAGMDATIKVWASGVKKSIKCTSTLTGHTGGIDSLSLHPSLPLCLTSSASDGTWRTWDYEVGQDLMRCDGSSSSGTTGVQHAVLHPDGLLVAGGADKVNGKSHGIVFWDLRQDSSQKTTVLGYSDSGSMTCMSFSPNGYNAVSGDAEGGVHVWDLRKAGTAGQAKVVSLRVGNGRCHSVRYDEAGKYLAACGAGVVDVYAHKKWSGPLVSLTSQKGDIRCVDFTKQSASMVTGSMDRTIKFWSPQ